MNNNLSLPENFKELEVYVPEWSLKTEKERAIKRACTPLEKLKKFQHERDRLVGYVESKGPAFRSPFIERRMNKLEKKIKEADDDLDSVLK